MSVKFIWAVILLLTSLNAYAAPKAMITDSPVWDDGSGCGCIQPCRPPIKQTKPH